MSKQEAFKGVSVGEVLAGKYKVEKILGMGGMGVVVAATHLDLREVRAIKLIRPDVETDQSVERFLREARAVVRLRSEHVAEVYDVGRLESGAPYIVMELLEGEDLSAMLKARGPFPIEEAVLYVTQACHALAEAHAAGIVHRDLKPGNLFLTRRLDGSPCIKVLDFGISKVTKSERLDPEMTGAKDLIGSPLYMSPEQMRSARKVDARADVWALGAILYKLITGRAPFHAPTVPEIFALTLSKQVRPPSALRHEISNELDAVILRCLDKQVQNRYPTAAELGAALVPHGPWEAAAADSANQFFRPVARRTSIPPEPAPVHSAPAFPVREPLLAAPSTSAQCVEMTEAMTGLARSNKVIRSGAISSWNGSRSYSLVRPGWLAFVVLLSILSAFVGASIVAFFGRTPNIAVATRAHELSNTNELRLPPAVVAPVPPVATVPSVILQEEPANVVTKVPPPARAPKVADKSQGLKRARAISSSDPPPIPPISAETKAQVHIPAKPETPMPITVDSFPRRE
jgi:serine/threonine protein kinase